MLAAMTFENIKRWVIAVYRVLVPSVWTPLRVAVAFSLFIGTVMAVETVWVWFDTRGGMLETATVVAEARTAGEATCPIGRWEKDYGYDYTWRSDNPPAGFSAEFVERDSCDAWRLGESTEIIRQYKDGELVVTTMALERFGDVLLFIAFGYSLLFLVVYAFAWLLRVLRFVFVRPAENMRNEFVWHLKLKKMKPNEPAIGEAND